MAAIRCEDFRNNRWLLSDIMVGQVNNDSPELKLSDNGYRRNLRVEKALDGDHRFIFYTDDLGYRTPRAPSATRTKIGTRIVCIGGSTTVEGLTNDTTYPGLLETKLHDRGHTATVYNCGVSGRSSEGVLSALPSILKSYQPDLLIHYNGINDIHWKLMPQANLESLDWLQLKGNESHLCRELAPDWVMAPPGKIEEMLLETVFPRYRKMVELARASSCEIAFCTFGMPNPSRRADRRMLDYSVNVHWWTRFVETTYAQYLRHIATYNRLIHEFCRQEQIPVIEVADRLPEGIDYFWDICHMTDAGINWKSETIAEQIAPTVRRIDKSRSN
jgi:hypothetical protein